MKNSGWFAAASLIGFTAACGPGPIDPEVTVESVTVSPRTAAVGQPGQTTPLTATVRGSDGSTLSVTVTWSSSDEGIATVSSSGPLTGVVTGVAAGTATIIANAKGVLGSATVTVNDPLPECTDTQTASLAAGESALYDATVCVVLPSGASGDRYRVAVYRPTAVADASDTSTVDLQVTGLGVSPGPPAAVVAPAPAPVPAFQGLRSPSLERSVRMAEATERAHLQRRRQGARLWAALGPEALLPSRPGGLLPRRVTSPDKVQLFTRSPGTCAAGASVTALLIAENDDLAIYQDSTQNASTPVTGAQANRILSYYAAYGRQVIADYFGQPSDIDGNGKIVVFVTPSVTGFAAEVLERDLFAQEACPFSNEMEMAYVNNELIQLMERTPPSYQALETVVHEVRHIVDFYHRIAATRRTGTDQGHPSWIQEGTAEIAGGMSSRVAWAAVGGPAVGARVVREDFLTADTVDVLPENYGVLLRMARTVYYLSSQPNGLVVRPNGAALGNSVYASGWHFHRWLGDAYGNAGTPFADAAFFTQQNDSLTAGGLAGLEAITGKGFAQLLEEFFTAVMLNGTEAPDPARAFATYDFPTATDILADQPLGAYPWPVTEKSSAPGLSTPASFGSATYSGPIGPSGVRIHDFLSNGTGTGARIQARAEPPAKILVVRVR